MVTAPVAIIRSGRVLRVLLADDQNFALNFKFVNLFAFNAPMTQAIARHGSPVLSRVAMNILNVYLNQVLLGRRTPFTHVLTAIFEAAVIAAYVPPRVKRVAAQHVTAALFVVMDNAYSTDGMLVACARGQTWLPTTIRTSVAVRVSIISICDGHLNSFSGCPRNALVVAFPNFNVASTSEQVQCTCCVPGSVLSQGECVPREPS